MFGRFISVSLYTIAFLSVFTSSAFASTSSDSTLVVSGWIFQDNGSIVPAAMAVNRNSGGGVFVERDGSFLVRARPGDTLVFGSIGYYSVEKRVERYMRDTSLHITLRRLEVELGIAEVFAPRTLNNILKEIETLGYEEKDFRVSGVNAMQSPITFLYEQFSRVEKSKRLVAELENNDSRRALLQELFSKYVDYDIIQLKPEDFKRFAEFCDPGDELLQAWSQYEFIIYVKRQFSMFKMLPQKLDDSDYQYNY
jgi:hypothetical protein